MELIQIIIISLKLFALFAAIVVLVSYFIYKVKDRKRRKPYSDISTVEPVNNPIQIKVEPIENKSGRFQVLNVEMQPFHLADKEFIIKKKDIKNYFSNTSQRYKKNPAREPANIYDRYSNSNFEPMHKIKL